MNVIALVDYDKSQDNDYGYITAIINTDLDPEDLYEQINELKENDEAIVNYEEALMKLLEDLGCKIIALNPDIVNI